jgi:hypothetical protein
MKTKIATILFIGAIALFASCKKSTTGPTGPAGATGATGAQGNANVKIYNYGSTTLSSPYFDAKFIPAGLTAQKIDSSLVLVYYSESAGQWNMANGLGPGGFYATIQYTDPTPYVSVYLQDADGSSYSGGTVTWQKVRVVIAPTGSVFRTAKIDYSNYAEVAKYFNIKD